MDKPNNPQDRRNPQQPQKGGQQRPDVQRQGQNPPDRRRQEDEKTGK
jgi:hypothetical protein